MKEKKTTSGAKERLGEFAYSKGLSLNAFGKKVNLSSNYVKTFSGKAYPSTIKKILDVFPELNWNWVETGEGEMLLSNGIHIENIKNSGNMAGRDVNVNPFEGSARHLELLEEVAALRAKLEGAEKTIERLEGIIDKLLPTKQT